MHGIAWHWPATMLECIHVRSSAPLPSPLTGLPTPPFIALSSCPSDLQIPTPFTNCPPHPSQASARLPSQPPSSPLAHLPRLTLPLSLPRGLPLPPHTLPLSLPRGLPLPPHTLPLSLFSGVCSSSLAAKKTTGCMCRSTWMPLRPSTHPHRCGIIVWGGEVWE